jgi:MinD-like ATPase involved in chromosome partitioning or flagellar assembly
VVISQRTQRLTADVLHRLTDHVSHVVLIGEHPYIIPSTPVLTHINVTADPDELALMVEDALARTSSVTADSTSEVRETSEQRGRVVAVWGIPGAPGRSTLAIALADQAARTGVMTCLIDADIEGAAIGTHVGLSREGDSLLLACRLAERSGLNHDSARSVLTEVAPGLRVLTGLSDPHRWPEIAAHSLGSVLEWAAGTHQLVVVDASAGLHDTSDPAARGANPRAVTRAVLDHADAMLIVTQANPLAVQRLVFALSDLADYQRDARALGQNKESAPVHVIVNQSSRSSDLAEVRSVLERCGRDVSLSTFPADSALARAQWRGMLPSESRVDRSTKNALRRLVEGLAA